VLTQNIHQVNTVIPNKNILFIALMINKLNQSIDYLLAPPHPHGLPLAAKIAFILNLDVVFKRVVGVLIVVKLRMGAICLLFDEFVMKFIAIFTGIYNT